MFRTPGLPAAAGRHVCIALGLVAGVLSASPLQAQQAAAPAQAAQAAPTTRVFSGDAGMVLNFIKADKIADFEMVVAKLKEALAQERQAGAQAAGGELEDLQVGRARRRRQRALRVHHRSGRQGRRLQRVEHPGRSRSRPKVNEIYKEYAGAYATGQNIVNLTLVSDLGK